MCDPITVSVVTASEGGTGHTVFRVVTVTITLSFTGQEETDLRRSVSGR